MNMVSVSIFILVLALPCFIASFVDLDCPKEVMGQLGQPLVVECVVKGKQGGVNLMLYTVSWTKDEVPVLSYDSGAKKDKKDTPGYSFAEASWTNTNVRVSLLIANVAMEHEGTYLCSVLAVSGDADKKINVKVSAKYSEPTISSTQSRTILQCSSVGGYPEGELRWFDEDNKKYLPGDKMKAEKTGDLFKLSRNLTLLPEFNSSKYICMLFNASGVNEYNATRPFNPEASVKDKDPDKEPKWDQATKIVPPVAVIGSLIIGLLLVLLMRRRKQSQQARRPSAGPLMGSMDPPSVEDLEAQDKMINV